jgi:hypothetical protein
VVRIEAEPVVQETLAGQIMVDADDVGPALAAFESLHLLPADAGAGQDVVPIMLRSDASAEQIEAEPAPLILMRRLVTERRGREGLAEILGLEELRVRNGRADRAHRLERALALVHQRPEERRIVALVRIPVAVKGREARGRERLVDRRPHLDPGIAVGDAGGVIGELLREIGIEQAGVARAGAMVEQPADDFDAALPQHRQPLVAHEKSSFSGLSGAMLSQRIG